MPFSPRRLQAGERELGGDVFGGEFSAACARAAAFEQIERQESDMGTNSFGIDGVCGRACRGRQTRNGGNELRLLSVHSACRNKHRGRKKRNSQALHSISIQQEFVVAEV